MNKPLILLFLGAERVPKCILNSSSSDICSGVFELFAGAENYIHRLNRSWEKAHG